MKVATIGLDIAKHIFQVHGADVEGHPFLRRRLGRSQVARFFAKLPPCVVGMEACCGAHHWSRVIGGFGHTVRLIAPQFVKPYAKSNKNDAHDAEAICEAVSFNGRFRDECLNENWFRDLADAREKIAQWKQDYNAATFGTRLSDSGGVCKIGGDGLWKRRWLRHLGKRCAFPTFPQP